MKAIQYYSATEIMERARDIMVPMGNQLEAQRRIATLLSMHLAKIQAIDNGAEARQLVTNSAFIQGSTGCGKTYIIRSLAECCGLPFETVDCTSITQAGVRGKNLGDVFKEITKSNPDFFKHGGVLNLDEFDKGFYTNDPHHDAYNAQADYLKVLEGGTYAYASDGAQGKVELDKVLIILSGACSKIMPLLEKKYAPKALMGFSTGKAQEAPVDLGAKLTVDDLIDYGMMPEIASRVGTVIHIPDIDRSGYVSLMTDSARTTVVNRYKTLFAMRGIGFSVTDNAISRVATLCLERKVGARSIQAVFTEQLAVAYNSSDDDRRVNQVILDASDDGTQFRIEYGQGERGALPVFKKEEPFEDLPIRTELSSEEGINRLCSDLCNCEYFDNVATEALLYNFLQAFCRFLANECRPSERRIGSLIKLAQASNVQGRDEDFKGPLDIIAGDYMERLIKQDDQITLTVFSHYYKAFRALASECDSSALLPRAITVASNHYRDIKTCRCGVLCAG